MKTNKKHGSGNPEELKEATKNKEAIDKAFELIAKKEGFKVRTEPDKPTVSNCMVCGTGVNSSYLAEGVDYFDYFDADLGYIIICKGCACKVVSGFIRNVLKVGSKHKS